AGPTISADALAVLQADPWPGNVRELENVTRRLLLAARGLSIGADAARQTLAARSSDQAPPANSLSALAATLLARAERGEVSNAHAQLLAEAEREVLTQAIFLARGNQAKAARWLGLSRFTLREKLKQLGIHPAQHEFR
ncbi:MAG TPA: helix-turn-helix domain-containing protein, partial [Candidatus Dormibacteraeota bacterium]|nr:helix-turn-helix domain-containing protein [Candidatus Dormibacteraeota bacterium]